MRLVTKLWISVLAVIVAVAVALAWPAGTWLQGRETRLGDKTIPDALYLVAGEQDRRIEALVSFVEQLGADDGQSTSVDSAINKKPITNLQSPISNLQLLIGNDATISLWSREDQRNLSVAEWAAVKLEALLQGAGFSLVSYDAGRHQIFRRTESCLRLDKYPISNTQIQCPGEERQSLLFGNWILGVGYWVLSPMHSETRVQISIVPGNFSGTDGEMATLAGYLKSMPEIRRLAIVTSPFHVRRTFRRLRWHLDRADPASGSEDSGPMFLYSITPIPSLHDRLPWIVLSELGKILRDNAGLSQAPLLSRGK